MNAKLAILLAVLLGGMSCVFLLPRQLGYQPVGVRMELPKFLGGWLGSDAEITEKEREVLQDADFARKSYVNGRGDRVLVSIILAGQDMMTGIHRPERCLQAQGWNAEGSSQRAVLLSDGKPLPVTRLHNSRQLLFEGRSYPVGNVAYYWFIGHTRQTPSHEWRIFYDGIDRMVKGYNQRWAMVLVSSEITKNLRPDGRSEAETDQLVQEVISRLGPKIVQESVRR
jgi:EpsI family protein